MRSFTLPSACMRFKTLTMVPHDFALEFPERRKTNTLASASRPAVRIRDLLSLLEPATSYPSGKNNRINEIANFASRYRRRFMVSYADRSLNHSYQRDDRYFADALRRLTVETAPAEPGSCRDAAATSLAVWLPGPSR
jgi:hypothetical protein